MTEPTWTDEQRAELQALARAATRRDTELALGRLEEEFHRWRRGAIEVEALAAAVHRCVAGPLRAIESRTAEPATIVAEAVARGHLQAEQMSDGVREHIKRLLASMAC